MKEQHQQLNSRQSYKHNKIKTLIHVSCNQASNLSFMDCLWLLSLSSVMLFGKPKHEEREGNLTGRGEVVRCILFLYISDFSSFTETIHVTISPFCGRVLIRCLLHLALHVEYHNLITATCPRRAMRYYNFLHF